MGKSDPYIVVECGGQKRTSSVVKNSLNPVFNSRMTFMFDTDPKPDSFHLKLLDKDITQDDFLGELHHSFSDADTRDSR